MIKLLLAVVLVLVGAGGLWYISTLKADLAVSKANQLQLERGVEEQKQVIEMMRADAAAQQKINNELQTIVTKQQNDVASLQKRLDTNRLANIAKANPKALEERVNRGSINALRCIELAAGAKLTEEEKNAKTAREFNQECPGFWPGAN